MTVVQLGDKREKSPVTRDKDEHSEGPREVLYDDFPAGEEVARKLITKFHTHLVNAGIVFACRDRAQKKAGILSPGYVKKLSPEQRFAFRSYGKNDELPHFLLVIALEVWNLLAPNQRTAVIDHLLTHMIGEEDEKNGSMKWKIRPPEVREFAEVAERNGKWNPDLERMAESLDCKQ